MLRLLVAALLMVPAGFAQQSVDRFEELKQRQQDAFRQRQQQVQADWRDRQAALEQNWDQHLRRIEQNWQDRLASTRETFVQYSPDYRGRSRVHYNPEEAGGARLEIELLVEAGADREERIREGIEEQLQVVLDEQGPDPTLAETLKSPQGTQAGETDPEELAEALAKQAESRPQQDPSGKQVDLVRVVIPMVPDHLEKRARRWKPAVDRAAARWNLPADLVWAVIQTESYFNPNARSHVPAFGLMQLVPRYGGAEAWEIVHGRKGEPAPDVLYNGNDNIELGAAYLHKLRDVYYRKVEQPAKAEVLIICAYNTGPGNLNKALTSTGGSERLTSGRNKGFKRPQNASSRFKDALPVVERLDEESLRQKLLQDLPWQETVDYLQKVSERRAHYRSWSL